MIIANFTGEKIFSTSQDAFSLNQKSLFGEKNNNKIEYSLVEALFLINEEKMKIYQNSKEISEESLLKKFKKIDKRIEMKTSAFSDLRKKGHIVKTALKYGADFRVYTKGNKPGQAHSEWIVFVMRESDNLSGQDFAAKNRIAHSTKKKLLLAILDEESDLSYYEISWKKI